MRKQRLLDSEFDEAHESTGLMLWRVTNAWQAAQRSALKPFDLTHVQFVLLASLTWLGSENIVTQRQLAQHAGTDPMMTSQVLRVLESKRLIRRRSHPTDLRARTLHVTDKGVALANTANAAVEAVDTQFFAPLASERRRFTSLLCKVIPSGGS